MKRKKALSVDALLGRLVELLNVGGDSVDGLRRLVESLERASRSYTKTHWGRAPREVVMVDAAEPSGSLALPALGKLVSVVYETRKGRDREPTQYEHEFRRPLPLLLYAPHQRGRLIIAGGSYRTDERGIVG